MKLPFKIQPPEDLSTQIKLLSAALDEADCIIAGAGAGLSTSAGFLYSGERFRKYFSDFEEKYNFHDMYSSGFYPYDTLEEYWAFLGFPVLGHFLPDGLGELFFHALPLSLHCKKEDAAASSFQISLFGSISPDRPGGSPLCR